MECIGIEETKLREKKTWETWKCQSCWKCIRFYFSCKRNTGCRVNFSDWTMQKVQNRRVPRWRFSFRNSDEYWLCESSYNIKHSEDLFFGASVAPKGIIYRFILLIHHHHHFLQLFSLWSRLMAVLSLSPRARSVPLFQPNEDGCSGKTVQMYVLAAGDRHRTICKN